MVTFYPQTLDRSRPLPSGRRAHAWRLEGHHVSSHQKAPNPTEMFLGPCCKKILTCAGADVSLRKTGLNVPCTRTQSGGEGLQDACSPTTPFGVRKKTINEVQRHRKYCST